MLGFCCGCRFWTGPIFGGLLFVLLLWAAAYRLATMPPRLERSVRHPPPLSPSDAFASPPPPKEDGAERFALLVVFEKPASGDDDGDGGPPSPFPWAEDRQLLSQAESVVANMVLPLAMQKQRQNSRGWQQMVQRVKRQHRRAHGDVDRVGEQQGGRGHGLFSSFSLNDYLLARNATHPDNENATGDGHDDDLAFALDDLDEQLLEGIVASERHSFLPTTVSLDIEAEPDSGRWLAARGFLLPHDGDGDGEGGRGDDGPHGPFHSSEDYDTPAYSFRHCASLAEAQRLAAQLQRVWLPAVWAEFLGDRDDKDVFRQGGDGFDVDSALPWRKGSALRAVRWHPEWGGMRAREEEDEQPPRQRTREETAAVVQRYRWTAFPFSHFQDLYRYFPGRFEVLGLLSRASPQPRVAREQLERWDHFRCIVSTWQGGSGNNWVWGWDAVYSGITELTYALSSPRDGRIRRLREELLLREAAQGAAAAAQPDEELRAGFKGPFAQAAGDTTDGVAFATGSNGDTNDIDDIDDSVPAAPTRQYTAEQPTIATATSQQPTNTRRGGIQTDEL